ncbi:MAG TPA: RyR domain-containing protein [Natronosporangium sp.]
MRRAGGRSGWRYRPPRHDLPTQRAINTLRASFGLILVVALILGFVGFGQALHWSPAMLDLLYYDLQLFVLGAEPLAQLPDLPLALQIARFAAPSVTVYAFVEAGRLLFAEEWRRIRAHRAHHHAVVCGDGAVAAVLARRLLASRQRVVSVRSMVGTPFDWSVPLTVYGDPRDPEILRAAGVRRATAVYACTDDSTVNTAIAMAVDRLRRPGSTSVSVYVYVRDPDLCLTLQARYLGGAPSGGMRLDFFHLDDLAARKLFAVERLAPVGGRPPRLLVGGAGGFGRAVIVEAARRWRMRELGVPPPLPVAVVDPAATAAVAELTHRYPFLSATCRFTPYDDDLIRLLATGNLRDPPDLAVICYDDEEQALKTAITAERLWRAGDCSVVIRLDRLTAFRAAPDGDGTGAGGLDGAGDPLFDELSGRLRAFGVVHAACDPWLIGEDLVERLARVLHDRYRLALIQAGQTATSAEAMRRWEELPPDLRESNRQQARDIGRKLRAIGCVLVPRVGHDDTLLLDDDHIERLARMEHERWRAERLAAGWRYGDRHDPSRRLHPLLRDWEELPEPIRRRNHQALPEILADAGFQVVRAGSAIPAQVARG